MQYIQTIEKELKKRGISARKMLLELGYTDNLISKWKKNESEPSAVKLSRIAEYLGVSTDYLLGKDVSNEDKLKHEIASLTPKQRKLAEEYVQILKNQEEFEMFLQEKRKRHSPEPQT